METTCECNETLCGPCFDAKEKEMRVFFGLRADMTKQQVINQLNMMRPPAYEPIPGGDE